MPYYETRGELLQIIHTAHHDAFDSLDTAMEERTAIGPYFDYIEDDYVKGALSKVMASLQALIYGVRHVISDTAFDPEEHTIYDFLSEFAGGEALTWDKIISAWREAPPVGRGSTIIYIDAMRKEIWNEPVSFVDIAFPAGY